MIEPVTLYDSTTITNGSAALLNSALMTPPGNRPMLVRDIIFTLSVNSGGVNTSTELQLGALVRAKIRAGRFDFSNSHVPVWLYGHVPDMLVENIGFEGGDAVIADANGEFHKFARYRWVLPKPMYLPPGAALQASFSRDDSVATLPAFMTGATAITVRMSARGLLIHQRTDRTRVPFVGGFVPVTGQLQSREDDLRNTIDKTVDVHRLVGRMASSQSGSIFDLLGPTNESASGALGFRNQIRIRDNNQLEITNGLVPMCSVFPAQGRAWTFKRLMGVGDQFTVTLANAPVVAAWPMMSFVGSREERI